MTAQADDMIKALREELEAAEAARDAAQAALEDKAELMAMLAHEVRTPIGAMMTMADLMLSTQLDEMQRGYAWTMRRSAKSLIAIVNDVLDHSKLEAGKFTLLQRNFDLIAFLEDFASQIRAEAEIKGLTFSLEIDDDCPRHVVGDPTRIRQILFNYANNALKFTEAGEIILKVKVEVAQSGELLTRFEVHDTGVGFDQSQKARLFEPYVQGEDPLVERPRGTGLGLSIVRKLAELMSGDYGCSSVAGAGSVFWFSAILASAEEVDAGTDTDSAPFTASLEGHVLIVDDNSVNRTIISALLDHLSVSYDAVASGEEALQQVRHTHYDAVLVDLMMPGLDGFETARRLRALGGTGRSVPLIALSARAGDIDESLYLSAGIDDSLPKPVSAKSLYQVLANYLEKAMPLRDGTQG